MSLKKFLSLGVMSLVASAAISTSAMAQETKEYSVSTVLGNAFPWGQTAEKWVMAGVSNDLMLKIH